MKMYHGTVDAFVPSIKEEGLRPVAAHAWRASWNDGAEIRDTEPVDSVFLTKNKRHATEYAETRVRYFATKPGETFAMFDAPHFIIKKDEGTEVMQVKPVLIVVEMDDHDSHLEEDPHDFTALRFVGNVPPSKIIEVIPLATDIPEHINPLYDRNETSDESGLSASDYIKLLDHLMRAH